MKKLVIITFLFFLAVIAIGLFVNRSKLPAGIQINTRGQPTIGYPSAKVHVVVFEEPKCVNCKEFTLEIFPKIKKEFIDTNKILYTVIPVSFLPNSMPAANALLSVYHSDPLYPNDDLFFTYLDYIYMHQPDEKTDWANVETLVDFAMAASPAINLERLHSSIEKETYRRKVERNNDYGKHLMEGRLSTPTVYVDGIMVESLTYDAIKSLIVKLLEKNGVRG